MADDRFMVVVARLSLEGFLPRDDGKFAQTEAEAGLDRAERLAGPRGDLAMGEAAEVGEFQHMPLLGRERQQRAAHLIAQAAGGRLRGDIARLVGKGVEQRMVVRGLRCDRDRAWAGRLPPQLVEGEVAGDAEEPGAEAARIPVEGVRATPDAQEGLLRDFLRHLGLPDDAERKAVDDVRIPRVEQCERPLVPLADAGEERPVTRRLGSGREMEPRWRAVEQTPEIAAGDALILSPPVAATTRGSVASVTPPTSSSHTTVSGFSWYRCGQHSGRLVRGSERDRILL